MCARVAETNNNNSRASCTMDHTLLFLLIQYSTSNLYFACIYSIYLFIYYYFFVHFSIQISSLTSSPDSSPSPIAIALGQVSAASGSTTTTLATAAGNNNTAGNGHDNINMTGANSNWCVSF